MNKKYVNDIIAILYSIVIKQTDDFIPSKANITLLGLEHYLYCC